MMMNEKLEIGDVVQEKEGIRRNGLVLELKMKYLVRGKDKKPLPYESVHILWPDGKKMSYKTTFLEKMF